MEKLTIVALSIVIFAVLASADDNVGTAEQDGGSCSKKGDRVVAPNKEPMDATNCMSRDHLTTIRKTSEHNLFPPQVEGFIQLIHKFEYRSKEIVLRELISNAADALEKVRLLALEDKNVLDTNPELSIGIKADKKNGLLSIGDSGIGMTKDDLLRNFGTIKKYGGARFFGELPANPNAEDTNRMIEQIGVGLFSALLIAETIIVYTKHDDDVQYIWSCDIDGYSIVKDPRGPTLKRGTRIDLLLKKEAADFLEPDTLKNLIINGVEAVDFPIYLCNSKTIQIEHGDGEAAETGNKEDNEIRVDAVDAKSTESADDSEKRIVEKIVCDWERLNIATPKSYRTKYVRRTMPNINEVVTNLLRSAYNISSSTIAP